MTGRGTRATMKCLQLMHSIRFLAVTGLKPTLTNIVWPHCGQSIRMITDWEESFSDKDARSDARGSSAWVASTTPGDKATGHFQQSIINVCSIVNTLKLDGRDGWLTPDKSDYRK